MGAIIEKLAFVDVDCTYDKNVKHLTFVNRKDMNLSSITKYKIPVRHLHVSDKYKTILMCHGNGEDIGNNDLEHMSNLFNANICVFDYAGYGLHTCKIPSEANCQKDVIAVYKYLINVKNINPNNICIYGRSLGSGVACFLAHYLKDFTEKPQQLILISPLMSAVKVVTDRWVPVDIFMNYALAPEINCSTLIMHGNRDEVVSYSCGRELSTNFPNLYKFYTLKNCGHNNINTRKYYREINKFLNSN
jgi:acetyl esterase/lipase